MIVTDKKERARFVRFAVVGASGSLVDIGVMNLLTLVFHLPLVIAGSISFVCAVTNNFIGNRYWTYPDSRTRSVRQQWTQFFMVSIAGLLFRLVWVRVLYMPFGNIGVDVLRAIGAADSMADAGTRRLGTNIAQFFAVWIVMVWNFLANRYWTYNDVE